MRRLLKAGRRILRRKAMPGTGLIPALFQHIQKTAGTTIVEIASQYYGSNMTSHGDHVGKPPEELMGVPFVSGHFGFDFARQLMPERYSFTFLRDPIARVLSMYHFCRRQKPDASPMYRIGRRPGLPRRLPPASDSPVVQSRIWNNQVWQLAHGWANLDKRQIDDFEPSRLLEMAQENLTAFSHVGFTEDFETDRDIILDGLGLQRPEKKIIANARKQPSEAGLSSTEMELLEQLTALDQVLYNHAWKMYKVAARAAQ